VAVSPGWQTLLRHDRRTGCRSDIYRSTTHRTDSVEGNVALGNFPATVQVSPNGFYVFVLELQPARRHGDRRASPVVGADEMAEIARIETCVMPHGSRLTADGRKHYSTCMMDEMLVEIDTRTLNVSRHFVVTRGREMGVTGAAARIWRDCRAT
jgi:DNA-binding beta-propeller fold protein YncE